MIDIALTSGMGGGAVCLVAFTAYTNYFDKKKALAVGVTASGSGVGTITIPIFLRYLFDHYSFSSTMLLYGKTNSLVPVQADVGLVYVGYSCHSHCVQRDNSTIC